MTTSSRASSRKWPEFVGAWPRLKGRQSPEFESKHDGDETEGDRAARFGSRIGLRCMPWEWLTLRAMLSLAAPDEYGDRVWTHRDVCIECTRQQGKTLLIVLRILFGLFILREMKIVYTAQRWSTAADVFDRVWAVIDRVPSLRKRLADKPSKSGNRGVIKLINGAKAEFGPRSQDFGRGYTEIDLLIVDEAYDVDAGQEANLTGAQSAAKNPQTIYISTAPVAAEHPKCQILAGLHRLGHARAADLYYAIYCAPRSMKRDDPDAWALAQPSYGVATNEREIRSKLQKAKTVAQKAIFDADYLGWGDYPPDEVESASPISAEHWATMEVDDVRLVGDRAIALERTRNRKLWAIAAAQHTADGRIFVEIGYTDTATNGEIVEYAVTVTTAFNPIALAMDARSAAAVLRPELEAAGIEPTMTNTVQLAHASGGFLDDALSGRLAHAGQQVLTDAVSSASMRELPGGGFTWDEQYGGDSAAQLKAATLARWALLEFGRPPKGKTVGARTAATPSSARSSRHSTTNFDAMTSAF